MTSEAPDRIWAQDAEPRECNFIGGGWWDDDIGSVQYPHTVEYIRADLHHEALDRIEALEAENNRLRSAFRVNMLRQGYSHDEIDEVIRAEGEG